MFNFSRSLAACGFCAGWAERVGFNLCALGRQRIAETDKHSEINRHQAALRIALTRRIHLDGMLDEVMPMLASTLFLLLSLKRFSC